jgi:hypothetical protein
MMGCGMSCDTARSGMSQCLKLGLEDDQGSCRPVGRVEFVYKLGRLLEAYEDCDDCTLKAVRNLDK